MIFGCFCSCLAAAVGDENFSHCFIVLVFLDEGDLLFCSMTIRLSDALGDCCRKDLALLRLGWRDDNWVVEMIGSSLVAGRSLASDVLVLSCRKDFTLLRFGWTGDNWVVETIVSSLVAGRSLASDVLVLSCRKDFTLLRFGWTDDNLVAGRSLVGEILVLSCRNDFTLLRLGCKDDNWVVETIGSSLVTARSLARSKGLLFNTVPLVMVAFGTLSFPGDLVAFTSFVCRDLALRLLGDAGNLAEEIIGSSFVVRIIGLGLLPFALVVVSAVVALLHDVILLHDFPFFFQAPPFFIVVDGSVVAAD